jgi:hypothetical protein
MPARRSELEALPVRRLRRARWIIAQSEEDEEEEKIGPTATYPTV